MRCRAAWELVQRLVLLLFSGYISMVYSVPYKHMMPCKLPLVYLALPVKSMSHTAIDTPKVQPRQPFPTFSEVIS